MNNQISLYKHYDKLSRDVIVFGNLGLLMFAITTLAGFLFRYSTQISTQIFVMLKGLGI